MNLLSPFITNLLMLGCSKPNYGKRAATLIGFLSLSAGYVLGCMGLYQYALPQWGKATALLSIGGVCLITSFIFFAFRDFLKPKPPSWKEGVSALESNLTGTIQQLTTSGEIIKILRPYISLKSLGTLFVMATVLAFYLNSSKKE